MPIEARFQTDEVPFVLAYVRYTVPWDWTEYVSSGRDVHSYCAAHPDQQFHILHDLTRGLPFPEGHIAIHVHAAARTRAENIIRSVVVGVPEKYQAIINTSFRIVSNHSLYWFNTLEEAYERIEADRASLN